MKLILGLGLGGDREVPGTDVGEASFCCTERLGLTGHQLKGCWREDAADGMAIGGRMIAQISISEQFGRQASEAGEHRHVSTERER